MAKLPKKAKLVAAAKDLGIEFDSSDTVGEIVRRTAATLKVEFSPKETDEAIWGKTKYNEAFKGAFGKPKAAKSNSKPKLKKDASAPKEKKESAPKEKKESAPKAKAKSVFTEAQALDLEDKIRSNYDASISHLQTIINRHYPNAGLEIKEAKVQDELPNKKVYLKAGKQRVPSAKNEFFKVFST